VSGEFWATKILSSWHLALVNTLGASRVMLKGIMFPYWPSLCNSITHQSIVLGSCSN